MVVELRIPNKILFLKENSSHFRRKVTRWGILKLPSLLNISLTNLTYSLHQLQTDFLQLSVSLPRVFDPKRDSSIYVTSW